VTDQEREGATPAVLPEDDRRAADTGEAAAGADEAASANPEGEQAGGYAGLAGLARRYRPTIIAYGLVLVLFAIGTIHTPGFAGWTNIRTLLVFGSFIGIIGFGQTLCILTGGIDLSVPWTLTGAAVLSSVLLKGSDANFVPVCLLVAGLAIGIGLINGIGVAYVGVPPIIMTLGMNGALQGLLLVYTNGGISSSPPQGLVNAVTDQVLGIPVILLSWIVVAVIAIVLLSATTYGRRLYAVGTNASAAKLAGVRVQRVLLVPYIVSALGASLAGLLLMGFTGQAYLTMGDPYLFTGAVAVAVGGTSILGGKGHYVGTIAGALILTLVSALLPLFWTSAAGVQIADGAILLGAVYAAGRRARGNGTGWLRHSLASFVAGNKA
jgi:ribose transport system permease protein